MDGLALLSFWRDLLKSDKVKKIGVVWDVIKRNFYKCSKKKEKKRKKPTILNFKTKYKMLNKYKVWLIIKYFLFNCFYFVYYTDYDKMSGFVWWGYGKET